MAGSVMVVSRWQVERPACDRENRPALIQVRAEGDRIAVRRRPRAAETWLGGRHAADDRQLRQLHLQPRAVPAGAVSGGRSEEHTSELQSLMRISYAVFCLKNKKTKQE